MVWLICLGLLVALAFGFLRYLEHGLLFYPARDVTHSPAQVGLRYEDVYFKSSDGTSLHGWFLPNRGAGRNLIYFHGNAGNISHRVEKMALLRDLGFNVFIFDYRGYGRSGGRPSEQGFYWDGEAAMDALRSRQDVGHLPTIIYGSSLGAAVAINTALYRRPQALILESSFTNIADMARIYYPWIPVALLRVHFDVFAKVAAIECPKFFIHSKGDEIVPFQMGQRLFNAAREPKEFLAVDGGHNDNVFVSIGEIRSALTNFFNTHGL